MFGIALRSTATWCVFTARILRCITLTLEASVRIRYFLSLLILPLLLAGCENTFTPKAPYEERVVVFSVLDPTAPYQVVRLESTFDAELDNPDERFGQRAIDSARVSIASDRRNFIFRDTLITLGDGSQKRVWINYDLKPSEGTTYTMSVDVPGFKRITASTQVPSRSYVQLQNTLNGIRVVGEDETAYPPDGFYFRLWVVGERIEGGTTTEVRREVPLRFDTETESYVFTEPSRQSVELFRLSEIVRIHDQMRTMDQVSGKYLVATGYSLDQYIYSYYKLVRGFDDPVSVRQDRPDVSNVANGVGIFGALFPDSNRVNYNTIVTQ